MIKNKPWLVGVAAEDVSGGGEGEKPATDTTADTEADTPAVDWRSVFPDDSPEDVAGKLSSWRDNAKKWQKRAESNAKEVEELKRVVEGAPDAAEVENLRAEHADLTRQLALVGVLSVNGFDIAALMDSRSFIDETRGFDPAADDFAENVLAAAKARRVPRPPTGLFGASEAEATPHRDDLSPLFKKYL